MPCAGNRIQRRFACSTAPTAKRFTAATFGRLENRRSEISRSSAAALFQMESFADTLERIRHHAQETEPSVFTVTAGGFVSLLRERIAAAKAYVVSLPGTQEQPSPSGDSAVGFKQGATSRQREITEQAPVPPRILILGSLPPPVPQIAFALNQRTFYTRFPSMAKIEPGIISKQNAFP